MCSGGHVCSLDLLVTQFSIEPILSPEAEIPLPTRQVDCSASSAETASTSHQSPVSPLGFSSFKFKSKVQIVTVLEVEECRSQAVVVSRCSMNVVSVRSVSSKNIPLSDV